MSIPDLLDRGGREFHHWSRSNKRLLGEGGFNIKASSFGSKSAKEQHRQTTSTSKVRGW